MLLYHLNEFKNAALWPAHMWSEANNIFLNAFPWNDNPLTRLASASNEVLERTTRVYSRPSFGIKKIEKNGKSIFVEEQVIREKPFCTLKKFVRKNKEGNIVLEEEPLVLIVPPLSGHFSTLLRDTIATTLIDHNVVVLDWHDARMVPVKKGEFSLETYVEYLLEFIEFLGTNIHIMAVCQPAVPVLMAVSILASRNSPNQPLSMILMGGPIDARVNPGKVNQFALDHSMDWFKRNIIATIPLYYPGADREVCPGFIMLNGFMALNLERHQEASFNLFLDLVKGDLEHAESHRKFYDEYRSVMDIPAEYFLESIQLIFKEFVLPLGNLTWNGHPIKPEVIKKTALMTIEGELDDISPLGQTFAAHDLCSHIPTSMKSHYVQEGVGHYGIFNGRRWRTQIYPQIKSFIVKNSIRDNIF